MGEEKLLTVLEAAEKAGITESGIRAAMYRGFLPFKQVYGRQVIAPSDLEQYLSTRHKGKPRFDGNKAGRPRKGEVEQPGE